jgi:glutaredoxin
MTSTPHPRRPASLRPSVGWAAVLACVAGLAGVMQPSVAQPYKVVASDGSVTYTDRPPLASGEKLSTVKTTGATTGASAAALPVDLREAVQRYPVTLYGSANCGPCDSGRQFLQQRGIPYTEKSVTTDDDGAMLMRLTGSNDLPAITIGAQVVRGWSSDGWASYLDAAGYPRASKLPAGYQFASATPLTEQRDASQKDKSARLPSLLTDAQEVRREPPPSTGGFKF